MPFISGAPCGKSWEKYKWVMDARTGCFVDSPSSLVKYAMRVWASGPGWEFGLAVLSNRTFYSSISMLFSVLATSYTCLLSTCYMVSVTKELNF